MNIEKIEDNYRIELTDIEARRIVSALGRTMARGEVLDVSIELEDKLWDCINQTIINEGT